MNLPDEQAVVNKQAPPGVAIVEDTELTVGADAELPKEAVDKPPLMPRNEDVIKASCPGVPGKV